MQNIAQSYKKANEIPTSSSSSFTSNMPKVDNKLKNISYRIIDGAVCGSQTCVRYPLIYFEFSSVF